MRANPSSQRSRCTGFTLIELVIAVVVVAILLAVAVPTFLDSMRKGRRSEAFAALAAVQQAQERWRSNNALYADNLSNGPTATPPGLGIPATTAPGGHYGLALSTVTATGYTVTAVANGSQANDGQCAKLGVQVDAGTILYAGADASSTLAGYSATHHCWSK